MDNKRKRKISPEQARHNEEIEILNNYLSQRRKAKRRKTILEKRLMDIREDMKHPISAVGYSPITHPRMKSDFGLRAENIRAGGPGNKGPFKSHGYYGLFRQEQRREGGPGALLHRRPYLGKRSRKNGGKQEPGLQPSQSRP